MQRSDVLATVERLCDVDIDELDRDQLAVVIASTATLRGWLDAVELRCTRRGRTLADEGRAEPAAALIARHTNRSSRDADQIDRRDRVAEAMPVFETGLDDGTVSAGHLDAIATATRHAPAEVRAAFATHEDELLAFAVGDTIETFTRRCRALVTQLTTEHTGNDASELERQRSASSIRTWVGQEDGLHHTHAALDPLRHEIFWTALNRAIRRRQQLDGNARTPWNQIQVDALIDAVTGHNPATGEATNTTSTADRPSPTATQAPSPAADIARDLLAAIDHSIGLPVDHVAHAVESPPMDDLPAEATDAELRRIEQRAPEINVVTDVRTIVEGLHEHSICETEDGIPLPVSTLRRLACDAEIFPIVLNGDSVPLDVGRSSRTVTPGQRRALRALHRTCGNLDCRVPFSQTKIHHIRWWVRDTGPTDIDNLVPLCDHCHHLVHEGGWTVDMTPDRIATWTRPDGTVHTHGPCTDRPPPGGSSP